MFALLQRSDDFGRTFDHAVLRLLRHMTFDPDTPLDLLIELSELCAAAGQMDAALDHIA
jgi:hypothetical protein